MRRKREIWAPVLEVGAVIILVGCGSSSSLGQDDEGDAVLDEARGDATETCDGNDADAAADADTGVNDGNEGGDTGGDLWGPLPAGCEHVFPPDAVRCDVRICPEEWNLCCGTYLCGDMTTFIQGCCNDETCGTGGEPMTYSCTEAGRASLVVTNCDRRTGTPCAADRPYCCYTWPGPLYLCTDHDLGHGWNCSR